MCRTTLCLTLQLTLSKDEFAVFKEGCHHDGKSEDSNGRVGGFSCLWTFGLVFLIQANFFQWLRLSNLKEEGSFDD